MSLFVAELGHSSRKEGRASMFICNMDMYRLMVYVHKVEEQKLMLREDFRNKKAKMRNESGRTKVA